MDSVFSEEDFLSCCGSTKFAYEMARAAPFNSYEHAVKAAREIWRNIVDVKGWLEAFSAHPQIGDSSSSVRKTETSAEWSKGEQSTALATATDSTLKEIYLWNGLYQQKFGFVFLICASGRSMPEILAELKKRYQNRPIVELEIAGEEQMKIIELRLAKLFTAEGKTSQQAVGLPEKPKGLRQLQPAPLMTSIMVMQSGTGGMNPLPAPLMTSIMVMQSGTGGMNPLPAPVMTSIMVMQSGTGDACSSKASHISGRTRPPITTHVLDVSRGCPGSGIEVQLEKWTGAQRAPSFSGRNSGEWVVQGSSVTDSDGRSGALMSIVDNIAPGIYRISFNTGKYSPAGFFPYVSIVFEVKETQMKEHFHVPLLLSPFSFTTYRGS